VPLFQGSDCRLVRSSYDLGNDYYRWTGVGSLARCQANCAADSRCQALTWVRSGRRNCALYDAKGAAEGEATEGQDSYICSSGKFPVSSGVSSGTSSPTFSTGSNFSPVPVPSTSTSTSTSTWLVGGDKRLARSAEALSSSSSGLCSVQLPQLPSGRASMMGGFLGGQVVACGGSSPERSQLSVFTDCWGACTGSGCRSWQRLPSMPHNTSNAGHAVAGGRLYVAGGYTQPLCGYRPEVQVYSPASGWSAPSSLDPPNRVGAYSCAVAVDSLIFFIGGWYPPSVYTSGCREDRYEGKELTRVNK